jgi:hypothetical protein
MLAHYSIKESKDLKNIRVLFWSESSAPNKNEPLFSKFSPSFR